MRTSFVPSQALDRCTECIDANASLICIILLLLRSLKDFIIKLKRRKLTLFGFESKIQEGTCPQELAMETR